MKAQVSEVKSIMLDDIYKAIDRVGQNLTTSKDNAENLCDSVREFFLSGDQLSGMNVFNCTIFNFL